MTFCAQLGRCVGVMVDINFLINVVQNLSKIAKGDWCNKIVKKIKKKLKI